MRHAVAGVLAATVVLAAGPEARGQPVETGAALGVPAPADRAPEPRSSLTGPANALGDPRLAPATAERSAPGAAERNAPGAPEEPWGGPRVELGYSHYVLVDGFGGGDVHAGFFGGYFGLGRVRLGGSLDLGGRDYSLGQTDALARVTLIGGYQHLPWRPFVPYAGLVATAGLLVGKRFRTPLAHAILGGGLEVGADYNLVRSLYLGASLAYVRADVSGIGYDLWILRLRVGL